MRCAGFRLGRKGRIDAWDVEEKERQGVCSVGYVCQPHDGLATLSRVVRGHDERKEE